MAGNTKGNQQVIAFTLPISCQICLGKVKQPTVCPNQHVFCSPCMDLWLERNQQCPACRVEITEENPCKKVLGGLNQLENRDEGFSNRELRRARMDMLYKDYEDEIEKLQIELKALQTENFALREQVKFQKKKKKESKSEGKEEQEGTNESQEPGQRSPDMNMLMVLTKKLQDATGLYEKVRKDTKTLRQENNELRDENVNLGRENQRLRLDLVSRSPRRFGRYTVVAMETKLETYEKEMKQLQKALERSDTYIENIEQELEVYRKVLQQNPAILAKVKAELAANDVKNNKVCKNNETKGPDAPEGTNATQTVTASTASQAKSSQGHNRRNVSQTGNKLPNQNSQSLNGPSASVSSAVSSSGTSNKRNTPQPRNGDVHIGVSVEKMDVEHANVHVSSSQDRRTQSMRSAAINMTAGCSGQSLNVKSSSVSSEVSSTAARNPGDQRHSQKAVYEHVSQSVMKAVPHSCSAVGNTAVNTASAQSPLRRSPRKAAGQQSERNIRESSMSSKDVNSVNSVQSKGASRDVVTNRPSGKDPAFVPTNLSVSLSDVARLNRHTSSVAGSAGNTRTSTSTKTSSEFIHKSASVSQAQKDNYPKALTQGTTAAVPGHVEQNRMNSITQAVSLKPQTGGGEADSFDLDMPSPFSPTNSTEPNSQKEVASFLGEAVCINDTKHTLDSNLSLESCRKKLRFESDASMDVSSLHFSDDMPDKKSLVPKSGKIVTFDDEVSFNAPSQSKESVNVTSDLDVTLDDTAAAETELKGLDISVTPELRDCMKLLNAAEKKVAGKPRKSHDMSETWSLSPPSNVGGDSTMDSSVNIFDDYTKVRTKPAQSQSKGLYSTSQITQQTAGVQSQLSGQGKNIAANSVANFGNPSSYGVQDSVYHPANSLPKVPGFHGASLPGFHGTSSVTGVNSQYSAPRGSNQYITSALQQRHPEPPGDRLRHSQVDLTTKLVPPCPQGLSASLRGVPNPQRFPQPGSFGSSLPVQGSYSSQSSLSDLHRFSLNTNRAATPGLTAGSSSVSSTYNPAALICTGVLAQSQYNSHITVSAADSSKLHHLSTGSRVSEPYSDGHVTSALNQNGLSGLGLPYSSVRSSSGVGDHVRPQAALANSLLHPNHGIGAITHNPPAMQGGLNSMSFSSTYNSSRFPMTGSSYDIGTRPSSVTTLPPGDLHQSYSIIDPSRPRSAPGDYTGVNNYAPFDFSGRF